MTAETLAASRDAICGAFGVLPALFNNQAQGPLVREAQRHLCQWTLQPIAALVAEEATDKLGSAVTIDTLRPLQAYDSGGVGRGRCSQSCRRWRLRRPARYRKPIWIRRSSWSICEISPIYRRTSSKSKKV